MTRKRKVNLQVHVVMTVNRRGAGGVRVGMRQGKRVKTEGGVDNSCLRV